MNTAAPCLYIAQRRAKEHQQRIPRRYGLLYLKAAWVQGAEQLNHFPVFEEVTCAVSLGKTSCLSYFSKAEQNKYAFLVHQTKMESLKLLQTPKQVCNLTTPKSCKDAYPQPRAVMLDILCRRWGTQEPAAQGPQSCVQVEWWPDLVTAEP